METMEVIAKDKTSGCVGPNSFEPGELYRSLEGSALLLTQFPVVDQVQYQNLLIWSLNLLSGAKPFEHGHWTSMPPLSALTYGAQPLRGFLRERGCYSKYFVL